jgi:hypothetical protein
MSENALFFALSSRRIADLLLRASRHVCYAAPGVHDEVATALITLKEKSPSVSLTVNLDFDEKTLRMGYGTLEAVERLRDHGIKLVHFAGFRSSILLVDDDGWVFTPTALYLEPEPHSDETPNALRLSRNQVRELLIRLSPSAREEAIREATTKEEAERIAETPLDVSAQPIEITHFNEVREAIILAPPVQFDVARQVRVFEPYLQYVELSLRGAAIQRHRIRIPKSIQHLGSSADLEGRLQTTFDLIEKSGSLSSKALETELNQIRQNLSPSLGKDHGRVVLKSVKPHLTLRIDQFRAKLAEHQARISSELQEYLDESKKQVVEHYYPLAEASPPDAMIGQSLFGKPTNEDIRAWLDGELDKVFPKAEELSSNMVLDVQFKDVTFETLNHPDFFEAVTKAYPRVDWVKAYDEFKAAGEVRKDSDITR